MIQGLSRLRCAQVVFGALTGLGLMAIAAPGRADVETGVTVVTANSYYRFGTNTTTFQQVAVNDPVVQQPGDTSGRDVEAVLTVPAFTPPAGAPGDTFFLPSTARAFQTPEGFNATSVDAAVASGLSYTEFVAETTWAQTVRVTNFLGLPTTVNLEYLLFPGAVGLSTFGGSGRVARVSSSIGVSILGDSASTPISESALELQYAAGSLFPTASATGDLAASPLALSSEIRNGIRHDVARSEAYVGSVRIGTFESDTIITVGYTLRASITMPGFEVAGFANIGDPFGLASDPDGYIASLFPGLGNVSFAVREAPAPVPLPGTGVALASGLGLLAARRRRALPEMRRES